ncbi:MAG: hypothetical protein ABFD04_12445 [Syntrophomonas sp.]
MPVTTFDPVQDVYISSAYADQNFYNRTQGNVLFAGSFTGAQLFFSAAGTGVYSVSAQTRDE